MKQIAIIGAGGFGREVKTLIDDINKVQLEYEFIGYFDDYLTAGQMINGFPVLGKVKDINNYSKPLCITIAIGKPGTKSLIITEIKNKHVSYPNLIHPSAIIADSSNKIGKGIIITAGCIVTCNVQLGDFVILNLMCTVGHDTQIEKYCSLMPSVNVSGEVLIKESVFIGTGSKIVNQIKIGCNSIIGAGAVVTRSIPSNCTAVGVPAKPIKFNHQ